MSRAHYSTLLYSFPTLAARHFPYVRVKIGREFELNRTQHQELVNLGMQLQRGRGWQLNRWRLSVTYCRCLTDS
jgi:hypothetical protein